MKQNAFELTSTHIFCILEPKQNTALPKHRSYCSILKSTNFRKQNCWQFDNLFGVGIHSVQIYIYNLHPLKTWGKCAPGVNIHMWVNAFAWQVFLLMYIYTCMQIYTHLYRSAYDRDIRSYIDISLYSFKMARVFFCFSSFVSHVPKRPLSMVCVIWSVVFVCSIRSIVFVLGTRLFSNTTPCAYIVLSTKQFPCPFKVTFKVWFFTKRSV